MIAAFTRSQRLTGALGGGACLVALALCVVDARAALTGWLAAFVFWSAIPMGALGLRMMTRLMPGIWSGEVAPVAEMLSTLLPLAALAVLPVLIGSHALYSWTGETAGGFRGLYLSTWFFALRSILFFVGTIVLGFLLATRPAWSMPLAAGGMIAFVLLDTTVATDWLMSLEPDFDSSGFGLYVLSIQMTIALMAAITIRLIAEAEPERPELLAALMLSVLLLWEYFAFMQYFIIWSENLPKRVAWFQERGRGGWAVAEYAIALLDLIPTVLLFFAPVRRSRLLLLGIAAAVLLAKAIEIAWLVFPASKAAPRVEWGSAILASIGLIGLSAAFFGWIGGARLRSRAAG